MSSPAPNDNTKPDDGRDENIPSRQSEMLPGISEFLHESAPTNEDQVSSIQTCNMGKKEHSLTGRRPMATLMVLVILYWALQSLEKLPNARIVLRTTKSMPL